MEIREFLIKYRNYRNLIKRIFLLSLFLTVFMRYNKNELFTESDEKYEKIVKTEQLKLFCEIISCRRRKEIERTYYKKVRKGILWS